MPDVMIPAWVDGTLAPVEKLAVHRRGLRHRAISVFVMDGDAVLLQRRAAGKYHTPGLWANTCCTHPHWGEDAHSCALRRLDDELGIKGLDLVRRATIEYRASVGDGLIEHEVVALFTAAATRGLALAPDPAEVAETRWATLAELRAEIAAEPQRFTPWIRIYLDRHAATIFGTAATT